MKIECREELDKLIKAEYKIRTGKVYHGEKVLTTYFEYFRNGNTVSITIKNVIAKMQEDNGAFDSWALAIKNWVNEIDNIILQWERPEDIRDSDYQRFLYRVEKATKVYKWLAVEEECSIHLQDDLMIKPGSVYVVNVPISDAQVKAVHEEAKVERVFVNCYYNKLANAINIDNACFYNQLPVGLFKGEIATTNQIFPAQNAMIDIWGLNKEKDELHIFELKKPNENPLGIYSELFFYSMFEKDIIKKEFIYKDIDHIKNYRGIIDLIKSNCKYIRAHFLTTKLHPLIDKQMIELINDALKEYDIQFDNIKYHINIECQKE